MSPLVIRRQTRPGRAQAQEIVMLQFLSRIFTSCSKTAAKKQASNARRKSRPAFDCLETRQAPAASVLRDVNPGADPSSPADLVRFNGLLFFSADDGIRGRELWKSDGTPGGTMIVRDINPGPTGSAPQQLTVAGNFLYFTADDGLHGRELWKVDGRTGHAVLVLDIYV